MPDNTPSSPVQGQNPAEGSQSPATEQQKRSGDTTEVRQGDVCAEIQGLETRIKKAEWWMVWLTAAIAFFGLCAVIVGVLQWSAMRGQLGEMKSSGVDTHALAEAAIASNRPWVGIGGIPTVRKESKRWYIAFSVKNFGPSPALQAVPSSGVENVSTTEEVNKAVERHCTDAGKIMTSGQDSSGPSGGQGYMLFPGKSAQLQPVSVPNNLQNILSFIGCVSYFDQFGKRPVHHTRFCYFAEVPLVVDKPMSACPVGWSAD